MLRIFWGRAHTPHARFLIGEMTANARRRPHSRQILLVPEPFSHESERLLCELGGDAVSFSCLSCEVLTFTRLAHRVLAAEGGLADAYLDAAGRLLLLARALETARPLLTHWGRAAGSPLFLEQLMATIDELKAYQATPDMLSVSVEPGVAATAALAAGAATVAKLGDLRVIWEAFDALAARAGAPADPADLPSRVAKLLETGSFAQNAELYIDGFISFTAQEQNILSAFIRRADNVTVCLACPPPSGRPEAEDSFGCWAQPRNTAAALIREAVRAGKEYQSVQRDCLFPEPEPEIHPALRWVEAYIMEDTIPDNENIPEFHGEAVILREAADVLGECEWAAGLARSWIGGGVDRGDIVISAPDWETYGAALESACLRHGLPLFTDSAAPLTHKAAARFLTAALEAAADGLTAGSVIALLKTGLTPLTEDQAFLLEDYMRVHAVKEAHWTRDERWTAHPSGWGRTEFSGRDAARLESVNAARARLRGPLAKLRAVFKKGRDGLTYTRALYEFCEDMGLPGTLAAQCERLERRGMARQAAEGRQLWGVVCHAMDACAEILDCPCSPEGFGRLFALCLTQYKVSVIPVALDCVHAGPYDRLRRRGPKRLILLGASEPYMPRASDAPGLLTDQERIMVEENGASLAPRAEARASRELYTLYRCFSLPTGVLAVSRPVSVDGAEARPSVFFERLAALTGAVPLPAEGNGPGADAPPPWVSNRAPLSPPHAGILLSKGRFLSPSRLQTYRVCPFQYFTRYGLRARPRPGPGPQPSDAGTLIHAVLRSVTDGVMARGGFHAVAREEALALAGTAADAYAAALPGRELRSARERRLLDGLRAAALAAAGDVFDELARSDFVPLATELEVRAPLDAGGGAGARGELAVRGLIDRLDGWEKDGKMYLRVTDYKTGGLKFSLGDVWHGVNLQILRYLFAVDAWGNLPAVPAGALYLPARDRPVSVRTGRPEPGELETVAANARRRDGLILNDPAVADAMERGPEKRYIPSGPRAKTASPEQMALLRRHVERVNREIAGGIRAGTVAARPISPYGGGSGGGSQSACETCEAKQACLFDREREAGLLLTPVKSEEFWTLLAETEGKGGEARGH